MANVDVKEVQKIKEMINQAELENAKNLGVIENIKKNWEETYGTDDPVELKKKLEEMKSDEENTKERLNKLYSDLMESQDWEQLEEELE